MEVTIYQRTHYCDARKYSSARNLSIVAHALTCLPLTNLISLWKLQYTNKRTYLTQASIVAQLAADRQAGLMCLLAPPTTHPTHNWINN